MQKRARNLINLGFEGAVKEAQRELVADNSSGIKATIYKWPEPCCNLDEWIDQGTGLVGYTCKQQSTCQGNYKACNPA